MKEIFDRTDLLIGQENRLELQGKRVLVLGLGGVGGTAAEALARSGIGALILVDCDIVAPSNLNRQILYTELDIGEKKALAATKRLSSITGETKFEAIDQRVDASFFEKLNGPIDFIVDAIDDVPAKIETFRYALNHDIPLITSTGMGNRLDPSQLALKRLSDTEGDPLAKKIRSLCRAEGIDMKKILAVVSKEAPVVKGSVPSSMMMVPSAAGLLMASVVIRSFIRLYSV